MQSFLYLKVDIHIFTLNLKGMLLWYISEKRNMGYEDTTGNHFQVWPFNEEYSLVCYPQSWEVNSERWSYNTLGSFCVPWVGDDSGLKCSRRTSEQKEPPLIWWWSSLSLSPPWTKLSLELVNLRHESHGAGMWSGTEMSHISASLLSLHTQSWSDVISYLLLIILYWYLCL